MATPENLAEHQQAVQTAHKAWRRPRDILRNYLGEKPEVTAFIKKHFQPLMKESEPLNSFRITSIASDMFSVPLTYSAPQHSSRPYFKRELTEADMSAFKQAISADPKLHRIAQGANKLSERANLRYTKLSQAEQALTEFEAIVLRKKAAPTAAQAAPITFDFLTKPEPLRERLSKATAGAVARVKGFFGQKAAPAATPATPEFIEPSLKPAHVDVDLSAPAVDIDLGAPAQTTIPDKYAIHPGFPPETAPAAAPVDPLGELADTWGSPAKPAAPATESIEQLLDKHATNRKPMPTVKPTWRERVTNLFNRTKKDPLIEQLVSFEEQAKAAKAKIDAAFKPEVKATGNSKAKIALGLGAAALGSWAAYEALRKDEKTQQPQQRQ